MLEKINKKILSILDKIFIGKNQKFSLFVTAFLDSIIAILPTDFIVIYYFIRNKKANPFSQSFFIAIGSFLGGSVLYFFGSYLLIFFPEILNSEYFLKIEEILNYNFWLQFLTIIFFVFSSVIPFTILSILIGIFQLPYLLIYIPAIFLGRFLRFFIISFFAKKYGEDTLNWLNKNTKLSIGILLIILLSYFLWIILY